MNIISCAYIAQSYDSNIYMLSFSFILIVFLAYITTRILVKSKVIGIKGKNIKVVEQVVLSNDKRLLIVSLNNKYYFLSSDKNNINLLDKLEEFSPIVDDGQSMVRFSEVFERIKRSNKDK